MRWINCDKEFLEELITQGVKDEENLEALPTWLMKMETQWASDIKKTGHNIAS
jgi:hypothetical protein